MDKSEKRGKAIVDVSAELILEALAAPEGTTLHSVQWQPWQPGSPVLRLFLSSPDLPPVDEGEPVPQLTPVITADYDKRPSTWLTWDWNLGD